MQRVVPEHDAAATVRGGRRWCGTPAGRVVLVVEPESTMVQLSLQCTECWPPVTSTRVAVMFDPRGVAVEPGSGHDLAVADVEALASLGHLDAGDAAVADGQREGWYATSSSHFARTSLPSITADEPLDSRKMHGPV